MGNTTSLVLISTCAASLIICFVQLHSNVDVGESLVPGKKSNVVDVARLALGKCHCEELLSIRK